MFRFNILIPFQILVIAAFVVFMTATFGINFTVLILLAFIIVMTFGMGGYS